MEAPTMVDNARFGTWVSCVDITAVEVLSQTGFDFLLVDGEHGHAPVHLLHTIAGAIQAAGRKLVYRVGYNRVELIKSALDQGADAVMVPMINTVDEAMAAVKAAKYPPLGERGIGPLRASRYYRDFDNYVQSANARTELIVQIESHLALDNCEEIAAVPGVDIFYVGPTDLASSLGIPLGSQAPDLLAAFSRVAEAAQANGKIAGIDCASSALIPKYRELGFRFFSVGSDTQYLTDGAEATLKACRSA